MQYTLAVLPDQIKPPNGEDPNVAKELFPQGGDSEDDGDDLLKEIESVQQDWLLSQAALYSNLNLLVQCNGHVACKVMWHHVTTNHVLNWSLKFVCWSII